MECLVAGLIVFVSVAALLIATLASARRDWNEALKHVARRFHGVFQGSTWFGAPSVWLRHGEAQARLSVIKVRGSRQEQCLQLTVQQRDVKTRCEIYYYQTRETMLPVRRGLLQLEFDWEDFRRRWHVLSEDGDDTRRLLSDGVRLAIELVWRQPLPGEMTISISPGWLVVRKLWRAPRAVDIEVFIDRVFALSDQLHLAAAAGIDFIISEEPQLLEDARCGVCGCGLASEIVVCRRCNTPLHRDCWQYGGGCATYGCGSKDFFVPGAAPLADRAETEDDSRRLKPR